MDVESKTVSSMGVSSTHTASSMGGVIAPAAHATGKGFHLSLSGVHDVCDGESLR